MASIERISVQQAHAKTSAKQALLVCAYEDEAKCRMFNLEGSISFTKFQPRATSLPKTQEFHLLLSVTRRSERCRSGSEIPSAGLHERQSAEGGVEAWKAAGYAMN
jgi:hypothetical protein